MPYNHRFRIRPIYIYGHVSVTSPYSFHASAVILFHMVFLCTPTHPLHKRKTTRIRTKYCSHNEKISIRMYLDDIHPDGDYSHRQTRPSVKPQGLLYSLNLFRTFHVATLIASGTFHVAFYLKVELYLRFSS